VPSVYDFKPRFQALLRPSIARLARVGLTANHVTLLALVGSIAVGALVLLAAGQPVWLLLLPAWLFVRMALNAIDGMMARELSMASNLGAVLNEIGDVVSDIALYAPLAWLWPQSQIAIGAFVAASVLTEFAGVLAKALGASRRYDGPMGKSDRAFVVGALALIALLAPRAVAAWPWIFGLLAVLAAATVVNRLARALGELRPRS
jgi:CDP-diacylglycerol--glycerol-3-phosphate 3-phosphatidyltransferase